MDHTDCSVHPGGSCREWDNRLDLPKLPSPYPDPYLVTEDRNRQLDKDRQLKLDNLMAHIRQWVSTTGGVTGELRIVKTWDNGQWAIETQIINPRSTWMLGI